MITTAMGEDNFAVSAFVKGKVEEFSKKHDLLAVEKFDLEEDELSKIFDSIYNFSLFSEAKLILVRGIEKDKEFAEKLIEKVESIPDETELVLFGGKPDKRSVSYKLLKKESDFNEFSLSQERDLAGWVVTKAEENDAKINRGDAMYLIDRVGQNKLNLSNEINKLSLYDKSISRASIDELTIADPKSTVFQLIDAAFGGNIKKAFALYDEQRAQKVEPLAVVGMIAWQIQILTVLALNKSKDPSVIAKEAKISPFVIQKNMPLARRLSRSDLKTIINKAYDLDYSLKNSRFDGDAAVKHFLLEIKEVIS